MGYTILRQTQMTKNCWVVLVHVVLKECVIEIAEL